jgi:hypothetical protein
MHLAASRSLAVASGASGPFFDIRAMLMDADRGGIDHLEMAVISLRDRSVAGIN